MMYNVMLPDGTKTKVDLPCDNIEAALEHIATKDWVKDEFGRYVQAINIVYLQTP